MRQTAAQFLKELSLKLGRQSRLNSSTPRPCNQIAEHLGRLQAKQREVQTKAFVVIQDAAVGAVLGQHIQRLDAANIQAVGQHERHAVLPGQRQARALLDLSDVPAQLFELRRQLLIADLRLAVAGRRQARVLVDAETG